MTLKQQAETFMAQIQTRRRNPVRQATVKAYRSHLDKWILPLLGGEDLAKIENGLVKNFIRKLSEAKLSAASITSIFNVVKQIVASAVDENGNRLYERTWNADFLDLPVINPASQKSPCVASDAIQKAVETAKGQDKALYALLAGSGLRIGEALALMTGPDDGKNSFWQPETGVVTIRTTVVNGKIQTSPKTEAGNRQVDLSEELNVFLTSHIETKIGLLFASAAGSPMRQMTAYEHLKKVGIPGFHSFRRFRITHLDTVGVPPGLQRFWTGHAAGDVHETYIKMGGKIEERKEWAKRAALGFQLEAA